MRKSFLLILVLLLASLCAVASANTVYTLEPCAGRLTLNEDLFIVLLPGNLADHPDLLSSTGKSAEEAKADWEARGVQLQAWTKDMSICMEITVTQDDLSRGYYDLEQQTPQVRKEYLKAVKEELAAQGYKFKDQESAPALKLYKAGGHFIMYEYHRQDGEQRIYGIGRKTVRNGYTFTLDYVRVDHRKITATDKDRIVKISNSIEFDALAPASVSENLSAGGTADQQGGDLPTGTVTASGLMTVTVGPPAETNEGVYTIEGRATPGGHVIGVVMHWNNDEPLRFTTDATKAGNFKLKVTLPQEGLWMTTVTLEVDGRDVAEEILGTTTYSKTMIPVLLDAEVPAELHSDELVISGTTSRGVDIQCIINNGDIKIPKDTVRTNGTGKFKFTIPTVNEGPYEIRLAFSKKGYDITPKTYTTNRVITAENLQERAAKQAIHPSYAALVKKLDTYVGQSMVYEAHITDVSQIGEEWIITAALKKDKKGYSNFLVFTAKDDPNLEVGSKVKLYGICTGPYPIQSEEENTSYPGFDLLFTE